MPVCCLAGSVWGTQPDTFLYMCSCTTPPQVEDMHASSGARVEDSDCAAQASVQLPALDADDLVQGFEQACYWIDGLWAACLDRWACAAGVFTSCQ